MPPHGSAPGSTRPLWQVAGLEMRHPDIIDDFHIASVKLVGGEKQL
jgi:hypothetical protein